MVSHDEPIPRLKKGKYQTEKPKNDQDNSAPLEDGRTYGIDCLNLVKPAHDSKNDSEKLLAQPR